MYLFSQQLCDLTEKKLEPHGTQTHTSHKPGKHLNHLDQWVYSLPVITLDTQEITLVS